jgi:hypothetical protein
MAPSAFLPRRIAGVDARQKMIFDAAAAVAKSREHLVSDCGASASWYFRRNGLHVMLSSVVAHGYGSHNFSVRIRWRRATVFQAVFHQKLFGDGKGRREVLLYDDVPGEWEALLAGMERRDSR